MCRLRILELCGWNWFRSMLAELSRQSVDSVRNSKLVDRAHFEAALEERLREEAGGLERAAFLALASLQCERALAYLTELKRRADFLQNSAGLDADTQYSRAGDYNYYENDEPPTNVSPLECASALLLLLETIFTGF